MLTLDNRDIPFVLKRLLAIIKSQLSKITIRNPNHFFCLQKAEQQQLNI
jgi:hypothetical protein